MDKFESVIQKAKKNPRFMKSWEYINSRVYAPDFTNMVVEMGPNCNLECFHCINECSPKKKGLPNPEFVDMAIRGAIPAGIRRVCLTSGEPLRSENREVIGIMGKGSKTIPVNIVTNGTFAGSYESAKDWFMFMKNSSFDFSTGFHNLSVSQGSMYPTSPENFGNILKASKSIFPKVDPGQFIGVQYVTWNNPKDDLQRTNRLIAQIYSILGHRRSEYTRFDELGDILIKVYPSRGAPIIITCFPIHPLGRAGRLPVFDSPLPVKELKPEDLAFTSEVPQSVELLYNGDVTFTNRGVASRGLTYGNVADTSLPEIMEEIRQDVFYQGYKLGGVPLLYHAAQSIQPSFSVKGRVRGEVIKSICDDGRLVARIREYFKREGVVGSYKQYVESLNLSEQKRLV